MRKLYIFGLIAIGGLIFGLAYAEQITLSTYYPAPYGVYREMNVNYLDLKNNEYDSSATPANMPADEKGRICFDQATDEIKISDGYGGWDPLGGGNWRLNGTDLYPNDSNWNVGIGTTNPEFRLTLDKGAASPDGGILALGTFRSGRILSSAGRGAKLIWYPRKGAFRAGVVYGTQWDDANIGEESVAMGRDAIASGWCSTAFGNQVTATGGGSFAGGEYAEATSKSVAMGDHAKASGYASVAMGHYVEAQAYMSAAFGCYNEISGDDGNWVDDDPIFAIGWGRNEGSRRNAFTVLKNGKIGIGTSSPTNILTVYGPRWHSPLLLYASDSLVSYDAFSITPYQDISYIGSGTYRKDGSWVHDGFGATNCLLGISGSTGGRWYASNNSAPSWNVASNRVLWNSQGLHSHSSSRELKENFTKLKAEEILKKISQLEVTRWNYKTEGSAVTHIGPVAEDFWQLFKTGDSDKSIALIDETGVALAGVKALLEKVKTQEQQIVKLQQEIEKLK
jgi:hypothetical protein